MGLFRQEYWSGLLCFPPGDLLDPGIKSTSLASPALAGGFFITMAPHSSTLAWKIPWTEEPGGLQSMGLLRVGHNWVTSLSLFTFMRWRRKWQPTPVFLPGESQGWGAWWAAVYGVAQSWTRLKWLSSTTWEAQSGILLSHKEDEMPCAATWVELGVGDRKNKRKAAPGKGRKRNL